MTASELTAEWAIHCLQQQEVQFVNIYLEDELKILQGHKTKAPA